MAFSRPSAVKIEEKQNQMEAEKQEASSQSWGNRVIEKVAGDNETLKYMLKALISVAGFLLGLGAGYLLFGKNKENETAELKHQLTDLKYELKKCERENRELQEKLQEYKEKNKQLESTLEQKEKQGFRPISDHRQNNYLD